MRQAMRITGRDDKRQFPRRDLPVGYCEIKVKREGHDRYDLMGHAYDISAGGVRFELDHALDCGEQVEVLVSLPGVYRRQVKARGTLVRYHDPNEEGPVRMGMIFTEMVNPEDRIAIDCYARGDSGAVA